MNLPRSDPPLQMFSTFREQHLAQWVRDCAMVCSGVVRGTRLCLAVLMYKPNIQYNPTRMLISDELLETEEVQLKPKFGVTTIPSRGVRLALYNWIASYNQSEIEEMCLSMGFSFRTVLNLITDHEYLPNLRTALGLEVISLGRVRVYDWAETFSLKQQAIDAVRASAATGLLQIANLSWPPNYSDDEIKRLRWELARRLTRPEDNLLGIVVKMGRPYVRRAERMKALKQQRVYPPCVSPGATDEEVKREQYLCRRRLSKRLAYKNGTRRDFDTD